MPNPTEPFEMVRFLGHGLVHEKTTVGLDFSKTGQLFCIISVLKATRALGSTQVSQTVANDPDSLTSYAGALETRRGDEEMAPAWQQPFNRGIAVSQYIRSNDFNKLVGKKIVLRAHHGGWIKPCVSRPRYTIWDVEDVERVQNRIATGDWPPLLKCEIEAERRRKKRYKAKRR